MTSKLKCPFCQQELERQYDYNRDTLFHKCNKCYFRGDTILWLALIQAKQDLDFFIKEQVRTTNALIERTKELDKCQKDLEIATKALKQIVCADKDGKPLKGVVSCWLDMDELNKCIEQIEHKE